MPLQPPFQLARSPGLGAVLQGGAALSAACCDGHGPEHTAPTITPERPVARRLRLSELDTNYLCSIIGTCLSTAALRKAMAHFIVVQGASDLDIHHDAVLMAGDAGPVAKSLHKVLDLAHAAALQRYARAEGAQALAALWAESLQQGEVPGAYWALLTHRDATPALRKQAFGEVHMLSHLVGAANRADIRRLVALEKDNSELRERIDRHHLRTQELLAGREDTIAALRRELAEARQDQAAANAADTATRLREELAHARAHGGALAAELAAAEQQLRSLCDSADNPTPGEPDAVSNPPAALARALHGQRVLYVGGRPSSTPAIRTLVLRHGGEFQRHDGGLEDRKGLLASGVAWADLVVFPVDCVDHDSAGNLKRLCQRQGIAWLPLRSAGLGSFAAALAEAGARPQPPRPGGPICLRHG